MLSITAKAKKKEKEKEKEKKEEEKMEVVGISYDTLLSFRSCTIQLSLPIAPCIAAVLTQVSTLSRCFIPFTKGGVGISILH